MEKLSNLVSDLPEITRNELFVSSLTFPKTASVTVDVPLISFLIENPQNTDYLWLKKTINEHTELNNDIREELSVIIEIMGDVHYYMNLSAFDFVQVSRYGLVILRLINHENSSNRSVSIDINDFRKKVYNYVYPRNNYKNYFIVGGLMAMGVIAGILQNTFRN